MRTETTWTIEKDTRSRGTADEPQYLFFPKYGNLPRQEVWLKGRTDEEAIADFRRRFPDLADDAVVVK